MLVNFKIALAWKGEHQIDLAMRTGVDPTLLSNVINGRRPASPKLRAKLAAALGVRERWLFSRRVMRANAPKPPLDSTSEAQAAVLQPTEQAGVTQ